MGDQTGPLHTCGGFSPTSIRIHAVASKSRYVVCSIAFLGADDVDSSLANGMYYITSSVWPWVAGGLTVPET